MKYTCKYYNGGGSEYNGGIWELKETDKTITFKQIEKSFFNPNCVLIRINKFYSKKIKREDNNYSAVRDCEENGLKYIGYYNNGHTLRRWEDGTFTAYPNQWGTPYYFEQITDKELERYKIKHCHKNN